MASELTVGKVGAGIAPAVPLHAKVSATTGSSPLEVARLEVEDDGSTDLVAGIGPKLAFYIPHNTASFEGASIAAKKEDSSDTNEATSLAFSTIPNAFGAPVERVTIDSAGLATFSAGINLGNTVSATATTLDGYEEGTFTVTTAGDSTGAFTSETGEYTRIGNCVYIRVVINVSTNFTAGVISGLPFGCVCAATASSWVPIGTALTSSATNAPIIGAVQNSVANLKFFNDATTTSTHLPNTTHYSYRVNGFYYTTDAF